MKPAEITASLDKTMGSGDKLLGGSILFIKIGSILDLFLYAPIQLIQVCALECVLLFDRVMDILLRINIVSAFSRIKIELK